ncbi:uroporphyrinogen-III synthase [Methylibium sp. Root1272]|uniref:uroporphyrinogen-III synthase n=1 Tax=Methylibium sp. Root1272 TaxID=1736441 RepID=UPI0006FFB020|nr:uroporphyrinogen-III synthase [Methylibium sp. Root1272]KQW69824.1 uroporphyrinogen-III synthase [Methylibium sp. Root1272]
MRVLVTRPEEQAREWVARLAERGVVAAALPLIAIEAPADPVPVRSAWQTLPQRSLLVFVSPNAVTQFFAQRPAGGDWPAALRFGSPGPGTSAALRAAGVAPGAIVEPPLDAGRFDSEALWAVLGPLGPWQGRSVLIVRGSVDGEAQGRGREWLSQVLRDAGAHVDLVAAYRRVPPRLDPAGQAVWAAALAAPAEHLWLFSSSEAIDQLDALTAAAGSAPDWQAAQALATHPRIAQRARSAGFGRVIEASPTLEAVVAAIGVSRSDGERPIESSAP